MYPSTNRRASLPTDGCQQQQQQPLKRECRVFEPQQWRQSVCKNCFRSEPEHITPSSVVATDLLIPTENVWPVTPAITRKTPVVPLAAGNTCGIPAASMDAATQGRGGANGRRGVVASSHGQRAADDLQRGLPVGHRATPAPVQAAQERTSHVAATGVFSSASSIDARYVEELENDFFDLEDKYDALARERNELSHELDAKVRNVEELQTSLEQYKEKAVTLERRCAHLEEEIKTYRERLRLPESDQDGGGSDLKATLAAALEGGEGSDDLRTRLNQVEQLCQDVMEENEVLKEEIEEMQREIEEMHDHFQEEDRDTMREMQRDLEAANKTCRILQFKLRKAERRFEQVDAERANLEERLTRLESEMYSEADVAHIRTLEEELRISKEVSSRLNNELDIVDEKRQFHESQNHQLNDELQICQNRRITSENEVDRLRLELDKLKCESRFADRGPLQVTDKKAGRHSSATVNSGIVSTDQSELISALQTTKEREADLSEQLRFAEEELRKMNRRVAEAQADNCALSRQMERLSVQQARGESPRATASQVKKEMATEEMSVSRPSHDHGVNEASAEKLRNALDDLERQRDANRLTTKQLNQMARDFLMLKANYKDPDWFGKYNEAVESQRSAEQKVNALKRKLADVQSDMPNAVAVRIDNRRSSIKSSDSRASMSKEWLLQKIDDYDKEIVDLETEITTLRDTASSLRSQSKRATEDHADMQSEVEQRDRELRLVIEQLEKKDFVVNGLLDLMIQRTHLLQQELDRFESTSKDKQDSETNREERFKNLEELLEKERERTRLLETQLNAGNDCTIPRPMISDNERARLREIDILKSQLDEKDEQLEDHESQIRELKNRVERAKKMNEAMKTLIEEPASPQHQQLPRLQAAPGVGIDSKQAAIEISSYRREIDSMRKEIAILQQKVTQIEKVREKLLIENKDLQEELKLREDSLFDQDDELEKRNADLNKAKRALELMQVELNEVRKDLANARSQEGMSVKLSTVLSENERLKTVVRSLEDETKVAKESLQKARALEEDATEKCRTMTEALKSSEAAVRSIEMELDNTKRSGQTMSEELATASGASAEARQRVKELEATVQDLQQQIKEHDIQSGVSPSASRNGGLSSTDGTKRPEIERLRRECMALRQERDEIVKEARKDRQMFEKRLQEACNPRVNLKDNNAANLVNAIDDTFARACAEKQLAKKVNLLIEYIFKQNGLISQLKIKNEIVQNKFLEYQRRYANLKEQYEAEQEAWLSERVVLESKAKEQEDRKVIIASSRKSLQETSLQLAEVEANFERERQRLEAEIARLEREKSEIKVNLTHLKEQQKLPKVLQRFSASPARAGHISAINAAASTSTVNAETTRRLDSAERTIVRLKSELQARLEAQSAAAVAAIKEADAARAFAESKMDSLNEQLIQLNLFREQAELFRERLVDSEQTADREYKIWAEEREDLLCRIDDSRILVDQWCLRLANREDIEGIRADEIVNEIAVEMERWRATRQYMPVYQRSPSEDTDILRLHTSDTQSMMGESMIGTPATQHRAFGHYTSPLSAGHRSTSVEWFNRPGTLGSTLRGSTVSLVAGVSPSLARSVTPSVVRCGRSVSPDLAVRKVTNYPDPTPGFLVRSRQPSVESLGSVTDVNYKPFNVPGKPTLRQPISPARRKFFDENSASSFDSVGGSFPKPDVVILPPVPRQSTSSHSVPKFSTSKAEPVLVVTENPKQTMPEVKTRSGSGRTASSVLSRISSRLTGSKTDLHKKSPPKEKTLSSPIEKRQSSPKEKRQLSPKEKRQLSPKEKRQSSPKEKRQPSPKDKNRSSPAKSPATLKKASRKSPEHVKTAPTAPATTGPPNVTTALAGQKQRRGSDMVQSLASRIQSSSSSTSSSAEKPLAPRTTRSGSLGVSSSGGIAPSIMALRQKFGGK